MREECTKHGLCLNILIPRPTAEDANPAGLCKVVIEFMDVISAVKARNAMHGRKFGGRTVTAVFLPEDSYVAGRYDDVAV